MIDLDIVGAVVHRSHHFPVFRSNLPKVGRKKGTAVARQLDSALLSVGFKMSKDLFNHFGELRELEAGHQAALLLDSVKKLVGAHVHHNVYFRDFPQNVPDTQEFWLDCITKALQVDAYPLDPGLVNLLSLPDYGRYLHSYEEMVEHQEEFIKAVSDRVTMLHLGSSLEEESRSLFLQLAGSRVPLSGSDLELLESLASEHSEVDQEIPVRENKAVINRALLNKGLPLNVDTVTDILRLACLLSDGDVTLTEKTKFKSFPRRQRRRLFSALDHVLQDGTKFQDVMRHQEAWKRLGERLHPHESKSEAVMDFFAIARGENKVATVPGQVELYLAQGLIKDAIDLLGRVPGQFVRSLDRLLRLSQSNSDEVLYLRKTLKRVLPKVSGRVVLSVWEHFLNRHEPLLNRDKTSKKRIFVNQKGKAWVTDDTRVGLDPLVVDEIIVLLADSVRDRLLSSGITRITYSKDMEQVALPLSEKDKASGIGVLPRGSIVPVHEEYLRFFCYWKQKKQRTDFDLSAMLLNKDFVFKDHLSWTSLSNLSGQHSGDITSAPDGASEFIDLCLGKVDKDSIIVPQVNIFHGEGFAEVEESFFGFMSRTESQKGLPFEPRTVRVKSDIRGDGRVAVPALFYYDSGWKCKWAALFSKGLSWGNRVESNRLSTAGLMRGIHEKRYITVGDLAALLEMRAEDAPALGPRTEGVTVHCDFNVPENPENGVTYLTPLNLSSLIPD